MEVIKESLFTSLDQLDADCDRQIFKDYQAFATRYGVELSSIDEAIGFLFFHEGLHSGYIMALKRTVHQLG